MGVGEDDAGGDEDAGSGGQFGVLPECFLGSDCRVDFQHVAKDHQALCFSRFAAFTVTAVACLKPTGFDRRFGEETYNIPQKQVKLFSRRQKEPYLLYYFPDHNFL